MPLLDALGAWAMRLMLRSRDQEAMTVLQQASSMAPQYPLPRLLLGVVAWSEGRAEEANSQIRQGLDLLSTDALRQMWAACLCGYSSTSARHHAGIARPNMRFD